MEGGGGGRPAADDCVESEYIIVWQYDTNTGPLLILEMIILKYIQTMLLTATSSSFNRVTVSYQAVATKCEMCPSDTLVCIIQHQLQLRNLIGALKLESDPTFCTFIRVCSQQPNRQRTILIINRMCYRLVKSRFRSRAIFVPCFCKTIALKVL